MSVSCKCDAGLKEYFKDPYSKPAVFRSGRVRHTNLYPLYPPKPIENPVVEETVKPKLIDNPPPKRKTPPPKAKKPKRKEAKKPDPKFKLPKPLLKPTF